MSCASSTSGCHAGSGAAKPAARRPEALANGSAEHSASLPACAEQAQAFDEDGAPGKKMESDLWLLCLPQWGQ